MDVLAGLDILDGDADSFSVFDDMAAFFNGMDGNLVVYGNIIQGGNVSRGIPIPVNGLPACRERFQHDDYIIGWLNKKCVVHFRSPFHRVVFIIIAQRSKKTRWHSGGTHLHPYKNVV